MAGKTHAQQFSVTNWGHKDGLPSTSIYAIAQTPEGFLWLGTGDGLTRFDGFQFTQPDLPGLHGQPLGQVIALQPIKDGGLIAGTASGQLVKWSGTSVDSIVLNSPIEKITKNEDQTIRLQTQSNSFLVNVENHFALSSAPLNGSPQKEKGNLIPQEQTKNSVDALGKAAVLIGKVTVQKILRTRDGATWLATSDRGIFRIAPTGVVQHFAQTMGLSSDHVWDMLEDREGNIWVGTQNGLSRLRPDKFITYTLRDGLLSDVATVLAPAENGGIWIGSQAGLERFSNGQHDILLKDNKVIGLLPLNGGTLLVATQRGLRQIVQRSVRSLNIETRHIEQMAQSGNGDLWLYGRAAGLWYWQHGSKPVPVKEPALTGQSVTSMRGGKSDRVWLGLSNGNVIERPAAGSHIFTPADGLPGGAVNFLSPQADGTLWAASEKGLAYYDGEHFRFWSRSTGLPGDRPLWVLPDNRKNLWLGYSIGVARLRIDELLHHTSASKEKLLYDFYDDGDGLKSNPDAHGNTPVTETSDGRLWLTMSEGIGMIDPEHIHLNPFPPLVHILQLVADGKVVDRGADRRLPASTRTIQISYTGLSFSEPRKVRFRYRMHGFDSNWQDAETRRNAFYTNLRPGHYRFQVLAANNDGIWNDTGDDLSFDILPAFYQTTWFFLISSLVIVSLVMGAYRIRMRLATRELQSHYEGQMAERTRIAQDLHDNLIQEMMAISLQLEIADEVTPSGTAAKGPLRRALDLSRTALASGRKALHILRQHPLTFADMVNTLKDTIQSMNGAQEAVSFATVGKERLIQPASGEEIVQIVREALRNAMQHAGGVGIVIRSEFSDQNFTVAVSDQGPGISGDMMENGKPGHFGIRGMKERAARIGATLTVNSSASMGTEWKLSVPASITYEPERSPVAVSALRRYMRSLQKSLRKKTHS